MVRRFLCLGVVLLLTLLSVPACSKENKNKAPTVRDPDGNFVPKPGGAKPG